MVIPAYNYGRFLAVAIQSVLTQTHPHVEIVVIDDGSTDNTREVVAAFGTQVRYIFQPNAGLSAARNTGINAASQPFIAFLDADDVFEPRLIKTAVAKFAELGDAFALVACRAGFIDGQGNELRHAHPSELLTGEIRSADIVLRTRFSPSGCVVRKSAFKEAGGFDTTLRSSEDRDMWIRISVCHRLFLLDDVLVYIRSHGSNMSSNGDRMKANMRKVLRKSFQNEVVPRSRLLFWLQVAGVYYYQTSLLFNGGRRRGQAFLDAIKSLCFWPVPYRSEVIDSPVSLVRLRLLCRILLNRA